MILRTFLICQNYILLQTILSTEGTDSVELLLKYMKTLFYWRKCSSGNL